MSSALFFLRIFSYPVLSNPPSSYQAYLPPSHLTSQYASQPNTLPQPAGTITDLSFLGGISSSIKPPAPDLSAGLSWKHFPSQPNKEFFQTCARNTRPWLGCLSKTKMGERVEKSLARDRWVRIRSCKFPFHPPPPLHSFLSLFFNPFVHANE